MRLAPACLLLLALAPCLASAGQDPKPEIKREASTPQADGKAHTLRTIPEACARIEGLFTGIEDRIAQFTDLVATAISNAQARADLAASRARIVAASDQTRRRTRTSSRSRAPAPTASRVRAWWMQRR